MPVWDAVICPLNSQVRSLGVLFDPTLLLEPHKCHLWPNSSFIFLGRFANCVLSLK